MIDPKPITVNTRVRTAKGFTGTVLEVKGNRARIQFDAPEGIASPPAWVALETAEGWAREHEGAPCGS